MKLKKILRQSWRVSKMDKMEILIERIIKVFRDTPKIHREYICHGEPHIYAIPDYDTIREKLIVILEDE